jgi:hypothetical protein
VSLNVFEKSQCGRCNHEVNSTSNDQKIYSREES